MLLLVRGISRPRRGRRLPDRLCPARDRDDHAAAVWIAAFGPDVAAVEVDDPAGDREAEAGAAGAGRARGVGAVEAFEHARAVGLGDARAVVDHLDRDGAVHTARADLDRA